LCHLQNCIDRRHSVEFQWIPGHCKIPGNETADGAATSAHTLFPNVEIPYSRSDVTSLINLQISHLLCECALYDAERELLKRILSQLDD
ncbi:uncharacterized protein LOC121834053, partial [Ixodes scapularis]|uniref:uncharacterized protein LOC121834053 n=1 Tax=Ixodes scapularis TaxID=6945 RepID=UPI001C38689C